MLRRVQRQVAVAHIPLEKLCCQTILDLTSATIGKFNLSASKFGNAPLDYLQLAAEIDTFFDTPDVLIPAALALSLNGCNDYNDEVQLEFNDIGWRCLYLLSLLPLSLRTLPSFVEDDFEAQQYLANVLIDATDARRRLIEGTLRYVVAIAQHQIGQGIPYLDLVQGFFGLYRAIETYKEYLGTHFQQHASTWIRQKSGVTSVIMHCQSACQNHRLDKLKNIQEQAEAFEEKTGVSFRSELLLTHAPENTNSEDREPNDALIAENRRKQFDLLTALNEYQMVTWPHLSWETGRLPNVEHGGIPIPLAELLIDPVSLDEQTDAIWFHIEYERFQNVLAKGRSKEMVEMRFGLVDGEAHTLEEVGQHFGVTRERIRQIEQNFLMQIRGRLMFQGADMTTYTRLDYVYESTQRRLQHGLAENEYQQSPQFDRIQEERSARNR